MPQPNRSLSRSEAAKPDPLSSENVFGHVKSIAESSSENPRWDFIFDSDDEKRALELASQLLGGADNGFSDS